MRRFAPYDRRRVRQRRIPASAPLPVYDPDADEDLVAWYRETASVTADLVVSWTDKAPVSVFGNPAAPTEATRPGGIAASEMAGEFGCRFDGTDDRMPITGAASTCQRLHNDADLTMWFAFYPTATGRAQNVICATMSAFGATNTGMVLFYDDAEQAVGFYVSNGSAYIAQIRGAAGSCPRDAAHILSIRKNADGVEINLDGALYLTREWISAPAAGDPTRALQFGRTNTGTVYFEGDLAEAGFSDSYQDLAAVDRYLLARYG